MDFYNRSSLTAYCTAFAYRPLSRRIQNINFGGVENVFDSSGVYLELPADSAHLYQPQHSPTPNWDTGTGSVHCQSRIQSDGNLYCHTPGEFHSRSNDSLLGNSPEENPQLPEGVFHVQCNQTFVAMVTMQYQARADMVTYYFSRYFLIFSSVSNPIVISYRYYSYPNSKLVNIGKIRLVD